ncbi:MAG: LemA family protein [Candidatus Roizmanbacteria bacterium GW2011_GWC2_37_13]|uniref:LemA family protein n=1 Tax=Candidatus Roizmanbacteria bacterium GW2011_GWC2_37_13 TaxID=1618486 RepID=A0A0G0JA55_9BACT|nr:MAG: LemA family protein [Candidatus Roizmanbacteria bacterium GW2011_GWC1_37_12]KKQ25081.1 MAG: LemA family protein [Candidatus Roizmanbacteria bacterium GW2011_GWC2_37_13]
MIASIGILAVLVLYIVAQYNGFVVLKTRIQEALSGIDVQLKRRADLIPNLVETVKGYAKHEKTVFTEVTKARSALMKAGSLEEKAKANDMLTGALKSLFAVAEAYPQLQASENFKDLQRQLEDTEDKVAYSRQFYNANVLDFNAKVQMFPSNMIANIFGFRAFEFFAATEEERKKVNINF